MEPRHFARSLPGHIATALAVVATSALTYLGASSIFYDRWGQPLPGLLVPLVPAIACVALCLGALRWPRAGGWLLLAAAASFAAWWLNLQVGKNRTLVQLAFSLAVMFGPLVVTGCLFLLEGRHRRLLREEGAAPPSGRAAPPGAARREGEPRNGTPGPDPMESGEEDWDRPGRAPPWRDGPTLRRHRPA